MRTSLETGAIKKFRRTSWSFQQTYRTPLKQLPQFVGAILGSLERCDGATVIVDAVAMSARHLEELFGQHDLPFNLTRDTSITAETPAEANELLAAALGDWVDFAFVPQPKSFVIFADHDEYTTLFATTKSKLTQVCGVLDSRGFEHVSSYQRSFG